MTRPSWLFRVVNEWRWRRYEARAAQGVVLLEVRASRLRGVVASAVRVERQP